MSSSYTVPEVFHSDRGRKATQHSTGKEPLGKTVNLILTLNCKHLNGFSGRPHLQESLSMNSIYWPFWGLLQDARLGYRHRPARV